MLTVEGPHSPCVYCAHINDKTSCANCPDGDLWLWRGPKSKVDDAEGEAT